MNKTERDLSKRKNFIKTPKITLKLSFNNNLNQEKYHRYYNSKPSENRGRFKQKKTFKLGNDLRSLIGESRFSFVKIRISLLILDLMLILFRCYNIYRDFQIIWVGSERFISYTYFSKISEGQSDVNIDQFMFERKVHANHIFLFSGSSYSNLHLILFKDNIFKEGLKFLMS